MELIFLATFTISVPLIYLLSLSGGGKFWHQRYRLEIMITLQAIFVSLLLINLLNATPESVFLNLGAAALMIGIACLEPAILILLICLVVAYARVEPAAVIFASIMAISTLALIIIRMFLPNPRMSSYSKMALLGATFVFIDYLPGMLFFLLATFTWLTSRAVDALRETESIKKNLGAAFELLEFPVTQELAALSLLEIANLSDTNRNSLNRLLERYADHALEISVKIDKLLGRAEELEMIIKDFSPGENPPEPANFVIESEALKLAEEIRIMETSLETSVRMREELGQCRKHLLQSLAGYVRQLHPLRASWARKLLDNFNPYSISGSSKSITELKNAEAVLRQTHKLLVSVGNNTRLVLELDFLLHRLNTANEGVYLGKHE